MIEMLGVLAIVGVLSAGGIAGYSMAMQSYKGTQLIERVNLIATRTRSLYKGTYTDVSNDNMINSGKLNATDFANPFGGNLEVYVDPCCSDVFYITTRQATIPSEVCVDVLTTDWGSSGVFWKFNVSETTLTGSPIASSTAISTCKNGNKFILWYFK